MNPTLTHWASGLLAGVAWLVTYAMDKHKKDHPRIGGGASVAAAILAGALAVILLAGLLLLTGCATCKQSAINDASKRNTTIQSDELHGDSDGAMSWLSDLFKSPPILLCRHIACALIDKYPQGIVVVGKRKSDGVEHAEVHLNGVALTLVDPTIREIPFTEFDGPTVEFDRDGFLSLKYDK